MIVGAGIAGCTAAIRYGRAGLRVALVEKHRSASTAKALCGHFVLAGTGPTLRAIGLWDRMLEAGAATGRVAVWSPAGWSVPAGDDLPPCISLRRSKLDPLLREVAARTPGVELLLGHQAVGLLTDGDRVAGVLASCGGVQRELRGRLVVAADGHRSPIAELAGVPADQGVNGRFLYWAYYRGAVDRGPGDNNLWFAGSDVGIVVHTDDGLTMLVAAPAKARLVEFQADLPAALEAFFARLPDGPDLAGAQRVSKVIGTADYPPIRRDPAPRRGLALVGDAAMAGDPVPAVGCGWAFRSADWLAEATIPALLGGAGAGPSLERALRRYRRAHRFADRHDRLDRADAKAQPPNAIQRAVRAAAVTDGELARRVYRHATRIDPVSGLVNPMVAVRALLVARRSRARAAQPAPVPHR